MAIPSIAARVLKKKWYRLLGIFRIVVPEISGSQGMFSRLQHALKAVDTRRVKLNPHVHDELNLWRHFVDLLEDWPTHLQKIPSPYPDMYWINRRLPHRYGRDLS